MRNTFQRFLDKTDVNLKTVVEPRMSCRSFYGSFLTLKEHFMDDVVVDDWKKLGLQPLTICSIDTPLLQYISLMLTFFGHAEIKHSLCIGMDHFQNTIYLGENKKMFSFQNCLVGLL